MENTVLLVQLVFVVAVLAGLWKVFEKAGQPGWAAIVPFYNLFVLVQVAGKPGWWFVLVLIPVVNAIIMLLVCMSIAEKFGKGGGYGIGLWLLGFVFFPMLGFSDAQYQGGGAEA